jgi:hypothetical protein
VMAVLVASIGIGPRKNYVRAADLRASISHAGRALIGD